MSTYIFYHEGCLDGFACAYIAWLKFGDSAHYIPIPTSEFSTTAPLEKYDLNRADIYILDVGLHPDVANILVSVAKSVHVMDHHLFKISDYTDPSIVVTPCLGLRSCGMDASCMLAWSYFFPDKEPPKLIRYVNDYQGQWLELPHTKQVMLALKNNMPWSFELWDGVSKDLGFGDENNQPVFYRMVQEGTTLRKMHTNMVSEFLKDVVRADIPGFPYTGYMANAPKRLYNDITQTLRKSEYVDFMGCWYLAGDGLVNVYIRSNGPCDVGEIARSFGGAGSSLTADFRVPLETCVSWVSTMTDEERKELLESL